MLPELAYPAVNWRDGMKISKDHLISSQNYCTDLVRDANSIAINSITYGLLPSADGNDSLSLHLDSYEQGYKVILNGCRAVTPDGSRIEILAEHQKNDMVHHADLEASFTWSEPNELDIIISVDPYSRQESGVPFENEDPPRVPFTIPAYKLMLVPKKDHKNYTYTNDMKIGEIVDKESAPTISENYIPPCTSTNAQSSIHRSYTEFGEILTKIEIASIKTMQNINKMLSDKDRNETVVKNTYLFVDKISTFLSSALSHYRLIVPHVSPVYFIEIFVRFSRLLNLFFKCLHDDDRGKFEHFIQKWLVDDYSPSIFENSMNRLLGLRYNHLDLAGHLSTVRNFVDPLSRMMQSLSTKEFIGKSKVDDNARNRGMKIYDSRKGIVFIDE